MKSRKLLALLISLLLHGVIVALLFVITLSSKLTEPSQKNITLIPVGVYGYEPASGGNSIPNKQESTEPTPKVTRPHSIPPSKKVPQQQSEKLITSKDSPAPTTEKQHKTKEEIEAEKRRLREKQEKAINSKIAGAFGKKSLKAEKSGEGKGDGGNNAIGAGYSLTGRNIVGSGGYPVRPEGFPPTRGTVVVLIKVNAAGDVIGASARLKGTNITNQTTLDAAIKAARKTKFNPSPGSPDQEGTITYHFDIQ